MMNTNVLSVEQEKSNIMKHMNAEVINLGKKFGSVRMDVVKKGEYIT